MGNHTLKYLKAKLLRGRVGKGFKIPNRSAEISPVGSIPVSFFTVIAICHMILGAYVLQNI